VQEAHDTAGTQSEAPLGRRRSWLPAAALAIIAIAGVIAGAIIFTMDDGAPGAPPTSSNNGAGAPTLTDQEAIDRYLELERLVIRAYRDVDLSLLPLIYAPDSPTRELVNRELNDLRDDSAKLVLRRQTEAIEVVSRSRDEIILRQEVVVSARLRPVGDVKVRARYHDQRRVLRVIIRYAEPGGWLIYRIIGIDSEPLDR